MSKTFHKYTPVVRQVLLSSAVQVRSYGCFTVNTRRPAHRLVGTP